MKGVGRWWHHTVDFRCCNWCFYCLVWTLFLTKFTLLPLSSLFKDRSQKNTHKHILLKEPRKNKTLGLYVIVTQLQKPFMERGGKGTDAWFKQCRGRCVFRNKNKEKSMPVWYIILGTHTCSWLIDRGSEWTWNIKWFLVLSLIIMSTWLFAHAWNCSWWQDITSKAKAVNFTLILHNCAQRLNKQAQDLHELQSCHKNWSFFTLVQRTRAFQSQEPTKDMLYNTQTEHKAFTVSLTLYFLPKALKMTYAPVWLWICRKEECPIRCFFVHPESSFFNSVFKICPYIWSSVC